MSLYRNFATINFPDVGLDGNNLFPLFGFGHFYHLPLGQVASCPVRHRPPRLASMATDWASHHATSAR